MIKKILVAYDGSAPARKAFDWACELAKLSKAQIVALAVAAVPAVPGDVEGEASIEAARDQLDKAVASLKKVPGAKGLKLRCEVVVGRPADHIVDYAKSAKADLIVIGHRSRNLAERLLAGSVAKAVVDRAPCPVLVAR